MGFTFIIPCFLPKLQPQTLFEAQMKFILPILIAAATLLSSCNTTPTPETGPDHPVQLPPPRVPDDPGYDAHLLIPQWDWKAQKWGYIDRTSREAVIPHMFRAAGRLQRGVAYATAINEDWTVEDVYRITADGQYKRIHEGKPEYGLKRRGRYQYSRLGDDYFFINQKDYTALHDPNGNRLWDTICDWSKFVLSSEHPAYLGDGHIAIHKGGFYEFRDRDFKPIARFDTTEYLIFFPNELYDWVRTGHQIPLIPALNLQTDKMGYLDRFGTVRIPFQYDRSELLEITNVRGSTLSYSQYSYRFDWFGHALVYQDSTPMLIDTTGKVIYQCPDSLRFNGDPLQFYNKTENAIVCQSRKTGSDHVIDLDDNQVVFSGRDIFKMDDTKYIIQEGEGRKVHISKMVDVSGNDIPLHLGDSVYSILQSSGYNSGDWEIWDKKNHSNILNAGGNLIGNWEYESVAAFSASGSSPFYIFYNYGETEGVFREKYRLSKVFLENGRSVTLTMRNVDLSVEPYSLGFTSLSNCNWGFATVSNMLFHLDYKWQEHRCRGFIDAFGHYYILD
jgi:hypothetical protein